MSVATLPVALLSPKEAADYLHTTEGNLAVWRCVKTVNIPYHKIGKSVRYRLDDLERFVESCRIAPPTAAE